MKKFYLTTTLLLSITSIIANAETNTSIQKIDKPQITQEKETYQGKHHHKRMHEDKKHGGFVDPNNPDSSQSSLKMFNENQPVNLISDKENWKDDQHIILQGKIIKQIDKDDFIFRDKSGEIEVEIKPRAWKGEVITPEDEIKILAEVDKSDKNLELEVRHIIKVVKTN